MPVLVCPRCQHVNPGTANFCFFDGVVLQEGANVGAHRLPTEFVFPSGRRCKNLEDLAQACMEEWRDSRDLLARGVFAQYFTSCGRLDLARAADEAKGEANPDIALTTFLTAIPGARAQMPKLDIHPRRILVGHLLVGESKTVSLTVTNQGHGQLQGTLSVTEGQDWLKIVETNAHEAPISTPKSQTFSATVQTRGVAAGQTYGAKLTVVTNGGVMEIPLRMDLVAQPFARAPFQGVKTQRELAERMRAQPKAAVPVLESGDVQRWFALNGWTYPVKGATIQGVAGVQQFFEGMGLSKPPPLELTPAEIRLTCPFGQTQRAECTLQTPLKKWVYALVTSQAPWLKVLSAEIAGPQKATFGIEVDARGWTNGPSSEGRVVVEANGGQKLWLRALVEVPGAPTASRPRPPEPPAPPPPPKPSPLAVAPPPAPVGPAPAATVAPPRTYGSIRKPAWLPGLVTMFLVIFGARLLLVPLVDGWARGSVVQSAAAKLDVPATEDSKVRKTAGYLELPWAKIIWSGDEQIPANVFQPNNEAFISAGEFRHYYTSYLARWLVLRLGWLGALGGGVLVLRRGGAWQDVPWGVLAGTLAGFGISATLAALFLFVETIPFTLWSITFGAQSGAFMGFLAVGVGLVVWLLVAVVASVALNVLPPLRRGCVVPAQAVLAEGFRLVNLNKLADYWSPA